MPRKKCEKDIKSYLPGYETFENWWDDLNKNTQEKIDQKC